MSTFECTACGTVWTPTGGKPARRPATRTCPDCARVAASRIPAVSKTGISRQRAGAVA